MTALSIRLRLAIHRSKLPDKALISAIEDASKPAPKLEPPIEADKPKRRYRRRDMRAE